MDSKYLTPPPTIGTSIINYSRLYYFELPIHLPLPFYLLCFLCRIHSVFLTAIIHHVLKHSWKGKTPQKPDTSKHS